MTGTTAHRADRRAVGAVATLVAAVALLVAGASPASADPAGPSDYRTTIEDTTPASGVSLEPVGGDAFLRLTVEPGTEVVVPGYSGEPYLRVRADGTVERNRSSPATSANEDRFGVAEGDVDADAEPDWERVGSGGIYAWHDHRTHWMSPNPPTHVERSHRPALISDWELTLVVDGEDVTVAGSLLWEPAVSPLPWAALAAATACGVALVGRRGRPMVVLGAALAVAGTAMAVVGWSQVTSQPAGLGPSAVVWVLPALAAFAGVGAAVAATVPARSRHATISALAGVAVLAPVTATHLAFLGRAVLPTDLPEIVVRGAIAVAAGVVVGGATLAASGLAATQPATTGRGGSPHGALPE